MTIQSLTPLPVYRTAEIRMIEAAALAADPRPALMERAGVAAAQIARSVAADRGQAILVIAGPGNNGGDAFVVARHLKAWWFKVDVVFTGEASRLAPDAQAALGAWRACGGITVDRIPPDRQWDLIVDGLFGIGLQRDLSGDYAKLVAAIHQIGTTVLALDVPSGLDSDNGRVRGCAVRADHTATFIGLKPGLLTLDGPDHCGRIHVCTLDLDQSALSTVCGGLIGSNIIQTVLPARRANSHKGSYGSVGIVGGARGMVGAALLAGRAALHLGAGRVYLGLLDADSPREDSGQPELMLRPAHEILQLADINCIAIGPGLGQSPDAHRLLMTALQSDVAVIADADALNLLAGDSLLQKLVAGRAAPTVLTPHPAEAARLLAGDTASVQSGRVAAACEIAARYRSAVVLKGAGSVCAMPGGRWFINTTGNPGMATAGMGDVLTGVIAALLAQGADAQKALLAGVHLHGAAADSLAAAHGPIGMTASECITAARRLFNQAQSSRRLPATGSLQAPQL